MKDMIYYVVEVSFRKTNPIHRSICFHRSGDHVELFGSYEDVITTNITNLAYFRVVEEITSMNEKFENQYKLPV
jgi:hypothetical protein